MLSRLSAEQRADVERRLWLRTERRDPDQCWLWFGAAATNGYGVIDICMDGKKLVRTRVHRLSYWLAHGPIPDGYVVMHKCDVRLCVNPAHLSAGTIQDNVRDMLAKGRGQGSGNRDKTHCPAGHFYSEENTYIRPNGYRICRTCKMDRQHRRYHEHFARAEAAEAELRRIAELLDSCGVPPALLVEDRVYLLAVRLAQGVPPHEEEQPNG